jgi:hypothetical protein
MGGAASGGWARDAILMAGRHTSANGAGPDRDNSAIARFEMFGQRPTVRCAHRRDKADRKRSIRLGGLNFSDAKACFRIGYQDGNSESKQSPMDSKPSAHGKESCARGDWTRKSRRQTEFRGLRRSIYVGSGRMSLICGGQYKRQKIE